MNVNVLPLNFVTAFFKAKEQLTYLSMDYLTDLKTAKRTATKKRTMLPLSDAMGGSLKKYFVLPDYQRITKGFVRTDDAVAGLTNDSVTSSDQVSLFSIFRMNMCFSSISKYRTDYFRH